MHGILYFRRCYDKELSSKLRLRERERPELAGERGFFFIIKNIEKATITTE